MKKVLLAFKSNAKPLEIKVPGIGPKMNFFDRILEFADFTKTAIFFILLMLFPFSYLFFESLGFETSVFLSVLIGCIFAFGLYGLQIALAFKKRFIDPKGLFYVLVFGLLTTTAAVLITPANAANTFGTTGLSSVRGISGLAVISFLGIYYLVNLLIRNESLAKLSLYSLVTGVVSYCVYILIVGIPEANILVLITLLPYLLLALLTEKNNLVKITLLIGAILYGYIIFENIVVSDGLFVLLLISFVVSTVLTVLFFKDKEKTVTTAFSSIKPSKFQFDISSIVNFIFNYVFSLLKFVSIFTFLILLVLTIYSFTKDKDSIDVFENTSTSYEAIWKEVKAAPGSELKLLSNSDIEVPAWAIGKGTVEANLGYPLFANVLLGQGLIGIAAYLLLVLFSFIYAIKSLFDKKDKYTFTYNFNVINSFVVLVIGIYSFFFYPGIFMLYTWWLAFSFIIANYTLSPVIKEFSKAQSINFRGRSTKAVGMALRLVLGLTLLALSFIFIYSLLNLRGDLI